MNSNPKSFWTPDAARAAQRRVATEGKSWGTAALVSEQFRAWAKKEGKPSASDPPPPEIAGERAVYPFTKGVDIANDGIGYGEQTKETVASPYGGELQPASDVRRRTRTGARPVAATPEQDEAPSATSFEPGASSFARSALRDSLFQGPAAMADPEEPPPSDDPSSY